MNSVILIVKSSYVTSTKYPRHAAGTRKNVKPIVVWKMKAPDKKPFAQHDFLEEVTAKVRRGSQKRPTNPMQALAEFQGPDGIQ